MADPLEEFMAQNAGLQGLEDGAADPLQDFINGNKALSNLEENERQNATITPTTPDKLSDTFGRGYETAAVGMQTDLDYFKGLGNTLLGREEAAAQNIREAQSAEERSNNSFGEMHEFSEFYENPTFEGFAEQTAKYAGMGIPYLLGTIGSGMGGAVASVVGKGVATASSRHIAKRLVRETLEKRMKGGTLDVDEKHLLEASYRLAKKTAPGRVASNLTAKRGFVAGQFGQEYSSMAGANFGENLEVEGVDNEEAAWRASLVAVPQALIGVAGEQFTAGLLRDSLSKVAAKRSVEKGSSFDAFSNIMKSTAKGAASEGVQEVAQDSLQIANRLSIDEDYGSQDVLMRIAESAFGGAAMGGPLGGSVSALGETSSGLKGVFSKANKYIEETRSMERDAQIDSEQFGEDTGISNPEPQSQLSAQMRAMLDETSERHSMWVEGTNPYREADASGEVSSVFAEDSNGEPVELFMKFIKGRGTIISKSRSVVDAVTESDASDASLAEALGYTGTREGADISVEALDAEGNVVWQEASTSDRWLESVSEAERQVPEGGSIRRRTIREALEDRQKLFNKEQGPTLRKTSGGEKVDRGYEEGRAARMMAADPNSDNNLLSNESEVFDESSRQRELEQATQVTEAAEYTEIGGLGSLASRVTDEATGEYKTYENTQANRVNFQLAFQQQYPNIDWSLPEFAKLTESLLLKATQLKLQTPDADIVFTFEGEGKIPTLKQGVADSALSSKTPINVEEKTKGKNENLDDSLALRKSEPGGRVPLSEYIRNAIQQAIKSRFANQKRVKGKGKGKWKEKTATEKVTISRAEVGSLIDEKGNVVAENVTEGTPLQEKTNGLTWVKSGSARTLIAVNLFDLIKSGQQIISSEDNTSYEEGSPLKARRNGLFRMLSELLAQGYTVNFGGKDISAGIIADLRKASDEYGKLSTSLQQELADLLDARDSDPDLFDEGLNNPDLLSQLEQRIDEELRVARQGEKGILSQMLQERREWAREFVEYKNSKNKDAKAPEKSELLAAMDVVAIPANETRGQMTVGKLLLIKPIEGTPRDASYEVLGAEGEVVFTGNKQAVQEFIEEGSLSSTATINKIEWNNVAKEEQRTPLTFEEFEKERSVGFQDRADNEMAAGGPGETEMFAQNAADNFKPDEENVFGRSNPGETANKSNYGLSGPANRVLNTARRLLKLAKPASIFSMDGLLTTSDADLRQMFKDSRVADYVISVAKELKENPESGGRYIGFKDAHIIIVDDSSGKNPIETSLVAAHELGHALFKEELEKTLENPQLYNRLLKSFAKARDAKGAPKSYQEKNGFEEWYADQFSTWAQKVTIDARAIEDATSEQITNAKKAESVGQNQTAKEIFNSRRLDKGLVGSHFLTITKKFLKFYNRLSQDFKKRFGKKAYSPDFTLYMNEVLARNATNSKFTTVKKGSRVATMPTYENKVLARAVAEQVKKETRPDWLVSTQKYVDKMIRSEGFGVVYGVFATADSQLRRIAGDGLADLMYGRAQDRNNRGKNKLGFVKMSALAGNKWFSKLEDAIDGDLKDPEVQKAFEEAFSDTPTAELELKNAVAIRNWFEQFYDDYIAPSNTDIAKRENYTPVVLKLSAIYDNPDAFIDLIMQSDPKADRQKVVRAVNKLVAFEQNTLDEAPIRIGEIDPAAATEKALQLTKLVDKQALRDQGFLEDPDVATVKYLGQIVKRVEWNRNTKTDNGFDLYADYMDRLSPSQRRDAQRIVEKYLGYNTKPLSPMWRNVQSVLTLMQIVALLPLAVIGSLPELAGPLILSKEFGSISKGFKTIAAQIKDPEEARRLARDIGVVSSQSSANVLMSQSEMEWMNDGARKLTDGFFRFTLLDQYTKFTREFAANMGVKFLEEHSNPKSRKRDSKRYMEELGLKDGDVQAWQKSNQDFTTPEGRRVEEALQRFVESSTLRPNAAERPLWASDPRFALIWQLKGFFYSYGKVLLAGAGREAGERLNAGSRGDVPQLAAIGGAAGVFALMGIATLPLAMLGMELREEAKYGLAWALPGFDEEDKNYFRTDDMGYGEYLSAAFSRSFAAGPMSIATQMMQAQDWGRGLFGAATVALGPTAETFERVITDGISSTVTNRLSPLSIL